VILKNQDLEYLGAFVEKEQDVKINGKSNAYLNCQSVWRFETRVPSHFTTQVEPEEWAKYIDERYNERSQFNQGCDSGCLLPVNLWTKLQPKMEELKKLNFEVVDMAILYRMIIEAHMNFNPTGYEKNEGTLAQRKNFWKLKPRNSIEGALGTGEHAIASGLRAFIQLEGDQFETTFRDLLAGLGLYSDLENKLKGDLEKLRGEPEDPKNCPFRWTKVNGHVLFTVEKRDHVCDGENCKEHVMFDKMCSNCAPLVKKL
jgi:hypothetical protein